MAKHTAANETDQLLSMHLLVSVHPFLLLS